MKYFVVFLVLIAFGLASHAYALEFSPFILTDRDDTTIYEGIVLQPVKFHLTLSNDEPDSVELNVNFATYSQDNTLLDSKVSSISIDGRELKTATYWFVPTTEGNYLTNVFVEYEDGTIPYSGDAIAFSALDATKEYEKQTITMYSDSSDEDCNVLCTNPSVLTIETGTVVEWTNKSPSYRSIATVEYIEEENGISWNSDHRLQSHPIGPDEKFSFLFLDAGNYQYFVAEHRLNQVAGTVYVTTLDTSINRTIDKLEQIMNNQNSTIPITSLSVNEKNSIITVGIDDGKDHNISLDVYKKMLRKQIGSVYFEVISDNKDHNIESPLKQIGLGIPISEIKCRNDLVLIQKYDGTPACVKPETKTKLIERGWGVMSQQSTVETIINIITEDGDDKLNPHQVVIDLEQTNVVTFVNNSPDPVRIQEVGENKIINIPKTAWHTKTIESGENLTMQFNSTGYYEFNVKKITDFLEGYFEHHATGDIVVLSNDTNSLPVDVRAKMAQSIVSSYFHEHPALHGVGSGGAPGTGVSISINEKELELREDAESYYYELYRNLIPFDVPITIEFSAPPRLLTG